jgi:hypothetical protein
MSLRATPILSCAEETFDCQKNSVANAFGSRNTFATKFVITDGSSLGVRQAPFGWFELLRYL